MSQTVINQEQGVAFGGMLVDMFDNGIESKYNAEASAEIGFGWCVVPGTGANADRGAILPSGGDLIQGIVVHSHSYAKGGNKPGIGTVGVLPKNMMNIMRHGRIWVFGDPTGSAIFAGARAFYDYTTHRFFAATGGGRTDCSGQVVFRTGLTVAGGLVQVECDFTNKP